jgi:undecaprenyl-diphosphatase
MNPESELTRWLWQWPASPTLDSVMLAVSRLTVPLAVLVPTGLWLRRRRRRAAALTLILLGAMAASVALQFVIMRPRPPVIDPAVPPSAFPSFPSGHAAVAFGYATLGLLVRRRAALLGFSGASMVGISRVYLGQHYPTDVIAGAILGSAVAVAVYGFLYRRKSGGRPWWSWLVWPSLAIVAILGLAADLGLLDLALLARPGIDKLLHLTLYGAVSLFALGWWVRIPAPVVVGCLSLVVLAQEAAQWLIPTRCFDVLDIAASVSGVLLGGWLGNKAARPQ